MNDKLRKILSLYTGNKSKKCDRPSQTIYSIPEMWNDKRSL